VAGELRRKRPDYQSSGNPDLDLWRQVEGRLAGLRVNRYSWWVHWRELADYILPRRYRWIITVNYAARGSPINQHILDSTGTLAARNLASGLLSGVSSPTKPWFRLRVGRIDSTQTSPVSLWLAECERLLRLVFQESNFYTALAVFYFDLVVFGTAVMIIHEDFDNVITCVNPCAGEFFCESNEKMENDTLYREFVLTASQMEQKFGFENLSRAIQGLIETGGPMLTREGIVGHAIEPNVDGRRFGIPDHFAYREVYWERGQSTQGANNRQGKFLRKRGFHEKPHIVVHWDLVANDPYGRSPAMDALPDVKQLQQEVRRKAQAIDKLVNPPMVADVQLKNQPASLLPGGVTYVSGMVSQGKPGFAPVYTVAPPVKEIMEDLNEVRDRINRIFFNDILRTASQFETRSNVTAMEWDMRRSESMLMLGPVIERITRGLSDCIERTFAIAARAGILPPAPPEIAGRNIDIEFVSMLATAQDSAQAAGIERLFQVIGGLVGVDPAVMDNVDVDFAVDKYSHLMNNDPRMIRSPQELAGIRQQRQQQQAAQQQAEMAEKLAQGAKTMSETNVGQGQNALQSMLGQT
jgi:Bacteriophage head to tail connecting protein